MASEHEGSITRPRVSVVINNHNYEVFVREAINSVLAQDYPDVETIVVDDCSTDASAEAIASYGDRLTFCRHADNSGQAAAINSGVALASGEIVMFLDADDFLYPDAVSRVVAAWHDDTAQLQARLDLVDVNGIKEDVFPAGEILFEDGDVKPLLARKGRFQTTVTSGLAFSRDVLRRMLPIPHKDFKQGADGFLVTVAPLYGAVVSVEASIGGYRRHGQNHSSFQASMGKRARWRLTHDEMRYKALRVHAERRGLTIAGDPGKHDPVHLEQRLVSLCFDADAHAYPEDSRHHLGLAGLRAAFSSSSSTPRRLVYAGMFLAAGLAPAPLARSALAWKLEQSSRPATIDWAVKRLRALLG